MVKQVISQSLHMRLFINGSLILLFCILCLSVHPAGCIAAPDRAITAAQWHELSKDKAFVYKEDKQKTHVPEKQEYKPNPFVKTIRAFFAFLSGINGFALACLLALGIVAFIIYRLAVSSGGGFIFGKRQKQMEGAGSGGEDAEDISGTNWERLLQVALNDNDIRLAVRYSYMWLLQLLQQRELIRYRIDKTNFDYYHELDGSDFKVPFKKLSRQYEYAWYGHYDLSSAGYNEFNALFRNLKSDLGA
jgi:hypothetical protein